MHKNHNAVCHDKCTFYNVQLIWANENKMKWCMDTYLHKTMASVASLEKIEIIRIRSQELMPSEARLKFLKKNDYFRA